MEQKLEFPKGFYWGAASASYQVEGNIYNTDWAYEAATTQRVPVADSGPDHWNRYKEDFDIAQSLGHNATRISIEWSRIEPQEGDFDIEAIRHYENVLREIKKRGMEPFVTLWHFTIPEWLYLKGGLENKDFPEYFEKYASYVMKNLSKHCSHWATINEPEVLISNGWVRGNWPPFKKVRFWSEMKVTNNVAKAHIKAYLAMKKIDLNSEVGIVKDNIYFHANKNPFNKITAYFVRKYWNFRFLNKIKNHFDSIGLNYYFHKGLGDKKNYKKNDMGWDIFPEGIFHTLVELKRYNKPVFVAEAGIADRDDIYRGQYIKDLVYWVHRAISSGVPVKGFMYWSLTDNFEWAKGYDQRFGLIEIDYETKERKIRNSAFVYKKICENNSLIIN
jgi:beta-glucosidase